MPKEEKKKRLLFSNLKLVPDPFLIPFTCRTFSKPLVSMTMSLYWSQGTSEELESVLPWKPDVQKGIYAMIG